MEIEGVGRFVFVLGSCVAAAGALAWFHKYSMRRYQYPVFSWRVMLRLAIGVLLLASGGWAFTFHREASDWYGLLLSLIGGAIVWWSVGQNFVRTSLAHGAIATSLQVLLVALFGPAVALVGLSLGGMAVVVFSLIVPVLVVANRRSRA